MCKTRHLPILSLTNINKLACVSCLFFATFVNIRLTIMVKKDINPSYLACPIRQVISRFGDKWSMLVLYTLHASEAGVLRFSELHHNMADCSQKMLSATLKNLEQTNLIHREVYPVVPPRVEYSLTDTGKSLMPAIISLIDWAKLHFDDVVTKQII
ncbi:probable transcriptional regulator [Prevotella intermedia]|uniref:Probable transcriptional regulator n=2 Tax=Prevotella intermedia TaxID=28131 RepID=A0A0S3UNS9_PREIN|nr:probable transcriptional regulator [Prevotella intermedia]